MNISQPRFATIAAFLGVFLCAPQTHSTDESAPFDAATVLRMTPPVFVELDACMSSHTCPPPKAPPPPQPKVRTPQPPNMNAINQRIISAQTAAVQAAMRNATAQVTAKQIQLAAKQAQAKPTFPGIYPATKLQRQVAEAHARAYMAALERDEVAALERGELEPSIFNKSDRAEKRLTKATTQTTKKTEKKPEKKKKKKRRHRTRSRYILVDTVKDKRASPKAKRVVMIWDTHAQALVGNNVYDLTSPPPLGKTLIFETYSAEYVGAGTVVPPDIER